MAMVNDETRVKILFIHDTDGKVWSQYLKSMFDKHYDVSTNIVLCSELNQSMILSYFVKVIILTPCMENNITPLLIANIENCGYYNIFHCNVNIKGCLQKFHFNVSNVVELKSTPENVREILLCIIQDYEAFANDEVYEEKEEGEIYMQMNLKLFCIDVVPEVLYPGQTIIFIMFNKNVEDRIHIKVHGIEESLEAIKVTSNIYTSEIPITTCGRKLLSVYCEHNKQAIFTTMLTIVSAESLMDNFLENLYCYTESSRPKEHNDVIVKHSFLTNKISMGTMFNPFRHVSSEVFENFIPKLRSILDYEESRNHSGRRSDTHGQRHKHKLEKKWTSGPTENSHCNENLSKSEKKFTSNMEKDIRLSATISRTSGPTKNSDSDVYNEHNKHGPPAKTNMLSKVKRFFAKTPKQPKYNRRSKRIRKAQIQKCDNIPDVPKQRK